MLKRSPMFLSALIVAACGSAATSGATDQDGGTVDPAPSPDGGPINRPVADGGPTPDGAPDDEAVPSPVWTTPTAPPDCDPAKPFGGPLLVPGLPAASLSNVGGTIEGSRITLSPDETAILFGQYLPGTSKEGHIVIAKRASRADAFGAATELVRGAAGTVFDDPTVTADGLTLYFKDQGRYGTWKAQRPNVQSPFGSAVRLQLGSSTFSNASALVVTADGTQIFGTLALPSPDFLFRFATTPPGNAGVEETALNADLGYGAGHLPHAALSADGLTIIYVRQLDSRGQSKYYSATRSGPNQLFGAGVEMTELGTLDINHISRPQWLSPDRCRLYRLDQIPGGNTALFVSTRAK